MAASDNSDNSNNSKSLLHQIQQRNPCAIAAVSDGDHVIITERHTFGADRTCKTCHTIVALLDDMTWAEITTWAPPPRGWKPATPLTAPDPTPPTSILPHYVIPHPLIPNFSTYCHLCVGDCPDDIQASVVNLRATGGELVPVCQGHFDILQNRMFAVHYEDIAL